MKWSSELKVEREQLEQRVKQLSNSITVRDGALTPLTPLTHSSFLTQL